MRVQIRFFTVLREITNKKEETVELPETQKTTIKQVLKSLSEKYGKRFTEYVYNSEGEVKSFLQFFVNGQSTIATEALNTELHDGDVLAIVPPVGGG